VDWDAMILVGRIARPHGIRGQVVVNPETDFVEERFAPGATFWARTGSGAEQLTVTSSRVQNGRPVVGFEGFATVADVERLAGLELRVPEETLKALEPGTYYHHQLAGCAVRTAAGEDVGRVVRVDGGSAGSLLAVAGARGEVLIPLAAEICVGIDVERRLITIEPPEGLLELNETKRSRRATPPPDDAR
jgi:16S rRNA processing protein RimM